MNELNAIKSEGLIDGLYPTKIFEHEYITGVLGIEVPLNESAPYSESLKQ